MVSVTFQTFGSTFNLRLRLYKRGEVRYINVGKYLRGNFSRKHWNQKRQCFMKSAPMSDINNKILEEFRKPYDELAHDWEGSVAGLIMTVKGEIDSEYMDGSDKLQWVVSKVIAEKKKLHHKDGSAKCTYEKYEMLEKKLNEYFCAMHQRYYNMLLSDMTPRVINDFLEFVESKRGEGSMYGASESLHAVLNWADKMGYYNMSALKGVHWAKKNTESVRKYQTLTSEQCKAFINLKKEDLPYNIKSPQWRWKSELYHDFCIFILFTCQSPCDALCLKYDDIQVINGVEHFVFKRRKIAGKQSTACSVPINKIMAEIMARWKKLAKDGYVFPVRNNMTIRRNIHDNNDIDKFIQRVNVWLKKVGPMIGVKFPLHNYVFRHTGITHYISKGVPIIYVANLAGTSVSNCESIYYNNQGDVTSRDMVMNATDF